MERKFTLILKSSIAFLLTCLLLACQSTSFHLKQDADYDVIHSSDIYPARLTGQIQQKQSKSIKLKKIANSQSACAWQKLGMAACHGKLVVVKAKRAKMIRQHPRISMGKVESYWDVDSNRQWIFISENSLTCKSIITAHGILKDKVGPCNKSARNHNQYCGVALDVKNYSCG